MKFTFLKAEWRKLIIANYIIDKELLKDYVPKGTELDLWNGQCYISLVGFMFLNTQVFGLKIPYHINFEEVNLRFYVKYKDGETWRRGVVFIKELVPKKAITFVANTFYKEHYQTLPIQHEWKIELKHIDIKYKLQTKDKTHFIYVKAENEITEILEGSEIEFITEHYWGYSKHSKSKTIEYEVTHPKWKHYPILASNIQFDFGMIYGDHFHFLNELNPTSIYLAEGSEITVKNKRSIVH